jgi:hypothetical protein
MANRKPSTLALIIGLTVSSTALAQDVQDKRQLPAGAATRELDKSAKSPATPIEGDTRSSTGQLVRDDDQGSGASREPHGERN